MIFNRGKKNNSSSDPSKELHKLKRQDLLELLLEQMRENDILRASAEDDKEDITYLTDLAERLQAQLEDKDALLEGLQIRFHKLTKEMNLLEREHVLLEIEDLFTTHLLAETTMQYRDLPSNVASPSLATVPQVELEPIPQLEPMPQPESTTSYKSRHFASLPTIED